MLPQKFALPFVFALSLCVILPSCGGVSQNTNLGSFTLSDSPGSVTVSQDGQGTNAITIVPADGFSGNISLSASGLPSGVTATFSPNPATASSTPTLTANPTAATGTASVTITGTSSGVNGSTSACVTIPGASSGVTGSTSVSVTVNALPAGAIKHVVIIFQENRTVDTLFHDPVLMQRGRSEEH